MKVDYPASTVAGELSIAVDYTLWMPDGVKTFRGIIVHQHGAGTTASIEGSTAAYDLHWQALAEKWDCALLGPSYHVLNKKIDLSPGGSELWFDPRHGSEKTFLHALNELATKSRHPELETVPWVLWGHSDGGIWANVMACLHPDRVVAMWLRSGSAAMFRTKPEFPQPEVPAAIYEIPTMCNPGMKEQQPLVETLATFKEFRLHGAPIGFAPDPRTGHECGDSRYHKTYADYSFLTVAEPITPENPLSQFRLGLPVFDDEGHRVLGDGCGLKVVTNARAESSCAKSPAHAGVNSQAQCRKIPSARSPSVS